MSFIAVGGVFPDLGAVGGSGKLSAVVGALLTVSLIVAVLMLVVCAVGSAIASSAGHAHAASRARVGAWVSAGTAVLAGVGVAWMNFLLDLGKTL